MNSLTAEISQMDLNDAPLTASSQNSNFQSAFTRVLRADPVNMGMFGNSVRSNGANQATARTGTLATKMGLKNSNQSLRALANSKGAAPSTTTRAPQPLATTKTNQQVQQQPTRTPTLNTKGSQSSIRSAQYAPTTEKQQKERPGAAFTIASSSALSSMEAKPSASKIAAQVAGSIDFGKYDGGFEAENARRGSAVFGEAAEILALDSSISAQVFFYPRLPFGVLKFYGPQHPPDQGMASECLRHGAPVRERQIRESVYGSNESGTQIHPRVEMPLQIRARRRKSRKADSARDRNPKEPSTPKRPEALWILPRRETHFPYA